MAMISTARTGILKIGKNSEIMASLGVVGIVMIMIMPLPTMLLDLFLSFNITFALIILLVSMYILKPLDLSSFPSILLLATLFRLSLNIASTRIILLNGHEGITAAGKVIKAFGNFVVGGNYVVGSIIFIILVLINLIVITKGSGRIGEVAARFTLDAMPGKQMSIDADLNAGMIDEQEARRRRQEISREADFYGAMDGASKFVKGDAIAGIIITLINILGGLTIGVLQNNMSIVKAAQNYTLLTVGDGLVSQLPALIISTAAGIVVTRAGTAHESTVGKDIFNQLMRKPQAIAIASVVLFFLGLVPGLPGIPFITLSFLAGGAAYFISKTQKLELSKSETEKKIKGKMQTPEQPDSLPPLDILSLEVGYGLIPLVDINQKGELLDRIKSMRRQMADEMGIIVPPVHIQDNMELRPAGYSLLLKGNKIAQGELMINHFLAMNPGSADGKINGIQTKEPTYGLPAVWIKENDKDRALAMGYTVVDLPTVLITHLSDVIRCNAHELIGRQEVQKLLDNIKETHPKVVDELVPGLLPLGGAVKILQNLLREQIPIRDLLTILEAMADWAPIIKDLDMLTEYVRQSLARTITKIHMSPDGSLPVITLDQKIEKMIGDSIMQTGQCGYLTMEPDFAKKIMNSLSQKIQNFAPLNQQPVVLCSPQIRSPFKKFTERFISNLTVLSYNDILNNIKIQSLGTVELADAN